MNIFAKECQNVWISGTHYQFEVVVGVHTITDVKEGEYFSEKNGLFRGPEIHKSLKNEPHPQFIFADKKCEAVRLSVCKGGNVCQVLFLIYASWPSVLPLPAGVFCLEFKTGRAPVGSRS